MTRTLHEITENSS